MGAETQFLKAGSVRYAWRRFGAGEGVPLLLLQRFGGTMDDWDPLLLEHLGAVRPLLLFDNAGIGRSSGETASTFGGIAQAAVAFVDGLGLAEVDVLGWSMGGYVASHFALEHPRRVRRLVLASSGPGYVAGAPEIPSGPRSTTGPGPRSPEDEDAEYVALNFPATSAGRSAGAAHLARLRSSPDRFTGPQLPASAAAQLAARARVMTPEGSLLGRFAALTQPALVAAGQQDARIPAFYGVAAALAMPNAKLILYPEAGHAFLFQRAAEFARDVVHFLEGLSRRGDA